MITCSCQERELPLLYHLEPSINYSQTHHSTLLFLNWQKLDWCRYDCVVYSRLIHVAYLDATYLSPFERMEIIILAGSWLMSEFKDGEAVSS